MSPIPLGILAASGGASESFALIQDINLTSDTASITFSNLNTLGYDHLRIYAYSSDNRASWNANNVWARFNGDTGANYAYNIIIGNATGTFTSQTANSSNGMLIWNSMAGGTDTRSYGYFIIDINNALSTSGRKILSYIGGQYGDSGEQTISQGTNTWSNTGAAISSINLYPNANDFDDGSRFAIFGFKGA